MFEKKEYFNKQKLKYCYILIWINTKFLKNFNLIK